MMIYLVKIEKRRKKRLLRAELGPDSTFFFAIPDFSATTYFSLSDRTLFGLTGKTLVVERTDVRGLVDAAEVVLTAGRS